MKTLNEQMSKEISKRVNLECVLRWYKPKCHRTDLSEASYRLLYVNTDNGVVSIGDDIEVLPLSLDELLNILPKSIRYNGHYYYWILTNSEIRYSYSDRDSEYHFPHMENSSNDTDGLVVPVARMIIYLCDNGYMECK